MTRTGTALAVTFTLFGSPTDACGNLCGYFPDSAGVTKGIATNKQGEIIIPVPSVNKVPGVADEDVRTYMTPDGKTVICTPLGEEIGIGAPAGMVICR